MGVAVIWDLDGTLFDSYPVIVESIYQTFREAGIPMTREKIKEYAIRSSSSALFHEVADAYSIAVTALFDRYSELSRARYQKILPMDGAKEVLQTLDNNGVSQFVYTHRGRTTVPVLNHLGMTSYFLDILTSRSGFARKPDPEALNHLIREYDLDREKTYYVGDRGLDMACARNAGVSGILFQKPGDIEVADGTENFIVSDLRQILDIVI